MTKKEARASLAKRLGIPPSALRKRSVQAAIDQYFAEVRQILTKEPDPLELLPRPTGTAVNGCRSGNRLQTEKRVPERFV